MRAPGTMAKRVERKRAIELRKQGLSYREIRSEVPVAKATLSLWLRQVGLAKAQRQRLTAKRLAATHRGAQQLYEEKLERIGRILLEVESEATSLAPQ